MILAMSISEQYLVAALPVPVQGLEGDAVGQGLDGEGDAVQGLQGVGLSARFR